MYNHMAEPKDTEELKETPASLPNKNKSKSVETSDEGKRIVDCPRGQLGSYEYNCAGVLQLLSAIW